MKSLLFILFWDRCYISMTSLRWDLGCWKRKNDCWENTEIIKSANNNIAFLPWLTSSIDSLVSSLYVQCINLNFKRVIIIITVDMNASGRMNWWFWFDNICYKHNIKINIQQIIKIHQILNNFNSTCLTLSKVDWMRTASVCINTFELM
jgi:hypothetical protein